jgi:hypothetical protein
MKPKKFISIHEAFELDDETAEDIALKIQGLVFGAKDAVAAIALGQDVVTSIEPENERSYAWLMLGRSLTQREEMAFRV